MNMMTMRTVRDAGGMVRHLPMPFVPSAPAKARKKRPVPDPIKTNGESAAEQLRLLIERVESMNEAIKDAQDDRKDVLSEAKARGFDVKAILAIVDRRKKDGDALAEQETILETYLLSLGLL